MKNKEIYVSSRNESGLESSTNPWEKAVENLSVSEPHKDSDQLAVSSLSLIKEKNKMDRGETTYDPFSFYKSDNIPTNPNGDLVLDPVVSKYSKDKISQGVFAMYTFTTTEDNNFLKTAETIKLANDKEINSELLKRCLTVDAYYSKVKHNINSGYSNMIDVISLDHKSTENDEEYSKFNFSGNSYRIDNGRDLIEGLTILEQNGQLGGLSDIEKNRLEEFKKLTSEEGFFEKVREAQYETTVDGKKRTLSGDDLASFLSLPTDKFKEIFETNPDEKIGQLSKIEFAYTAAKYLRYEASVKNYILTDELKHRIKSFVDGEYIDFSAINQLTKTHDTISEKINLNPELREAILSGMPSDASKLEKAAYTYIKMCHLLTYDDEFMATNQTGEVAEKHKNIDHLSQISLKNNKVVCYEFTTIYSKILRELGLNFERYIERKATDDRTYGSGHDYLTFRAGKFIVKADSTESIVYGDLAGVKLGILLDGFNCQNENDRTQSEFEAAVFRMYDLVFKQERTKHKMDEYETLTNKLQPVEFNEKQSILLDKLKSTRLSGMDAMAYALQLRKALFNDQERKNKASVVVIRNNKASGRDSGIEAGAVIAINEINFNEQPNRTNYYYLSSDRELTSITLDSIKAKLSDGTFESLTPNDPKIPGTASAIENKEEQ